MYGSFYVRTNDLRLKDVNFSESDHLFRMDDQTSRKPQQHGDSNRRVAVDPTALHQQHYRCVWDPKPVFVKPGSTTQSSHRIRSGVGGD